MEFRCEKCDEPYDVDISLVGRKVECVCGHKWILRETMPPIAYPRSLNENMVFDAKVTSNRSAEIYSVTAANQYGQYLEAAECCNTEPLDIAYVKLKDICASESPVPAIFIAFFKLCRKKNIADYKQRHYQAVVDRIKFMLLLDKKMCWIKWDAYDRSCGIPFETIVPRYSAITITDRKKLNKCIEILRCSGIANPEIIDWNLK